MKSTGYPDPVGDYWCVQIQWMGSQEFVSKLTADAVDRFVKKQGEGMWGANGRNWGEFQISD